MTADRFMTGGALNALPNRSDELLAKLRGRVLSGYIVEHLLGSGGMGFVFYARRTGGDFDRIAAIKVVPASLQSSELVQRFRREVQILAKLNHTSIAQLYDAGETEEGWPYLVMEYVDGHPIDTYCADKNLSIDDRVALLIRVVRAVQFAHARLIIHRDLKPSNVMVDRQGNPKLLDFGIAKLLESDTDQHTVGHLPMTPQYASPEQLLGADITTGSDIYQLGILCLAIVAEETPLGSTSIQDAIRKAASGRDLELSLHATRTIPTDLRAIIVRCLHTEPEDRYTEANALLNDLNRYSAAYPVDARRGSQLYRLRKLAQRNVAATVFAGLAIAIAVGGTASYTVDMAKARALAEERAETSGQILRTLSGMIVTTYSELIESRGTRTTVKTDEAELQNEPLRLVLERTEQLIDSVVTDQPELRAELLLVQGLTNRELSRIESADPQLTEALELMRETGNPTGEATAHLELMKLEMLRANYAAARSHLDDIEKLINLHFVPNPLKAEIYATASTLENDTANRSGALSYAKQAIGILESLPGGPTIELARAYNTIGQIYARMEQFEPLRRWQEKSIDLYIALEGPEYRGLAAAYSGLAYSYAIQGEYELALEYFSKELAVSRANYGERHIRTVLGLTNTGIALRRLGRYDEAVDNYLQAESTMRSIPGFDTTRFGALYVNLANAYRDRGDLEDAARTYNKGLEFTQEKKILPRDAASLLNNSGELMLVKGNTHDAIERLQLAMQAKTDLYGQDNISTARTMLLLVRGFIRIREFDEAMPLLNAAEEIFVSTYGTNHRKLSFMELIYGEYELARGNIEKARDKLLQAYNHRIEEYGRDHLFTLPVVYALVRTELAARDLNEANSWLTQARPGFESLDPAHTESIEYRILEAELLTAQGETESAQQTKFRAQTLVDTHFPARSDWVSRLLAI